MGLLSARAGVQRALGLLFFPLGYAWVALLYLLDLHFPVRLQLFEWCDQWIIPPPIKHHFQKTLTAQWLHRLPFIQSQPPVNHVVDLLHQVFSNISDINTTPYTIIDFCSGSGGPIPAIEKSINQQRKTQGVPPIKFRLSDVEPNLDAWMDLASRSAHLSFIPQPLDARRPPSSTISITSRASMTLPLNGQYTNGEVTLSGDVKVDEEQQRQRDADRERIRRTMTADSKVVHLYCLSFHHFDDHDARVVMGNSLRDSDAFAVLELQERTLGSLLMMLFEPLLLLLVSWSWFKHDWTHLFLVYGVPFLPFVHGWDGLVSCLRTRTAGEMRTLIDDVLSRERKEKEAALVLNGQPNNGRWSTGAESDWIISQVRTRHTWPAGYLTATIGIRGDVRRETQ